MPEIGVTEWRLGNGARVVLKPADFRADEILLAGTSPGGWSLAPDSLHVSALTATGVVQVGGVGDWDLVSLTKRLSGIAAGVGASIGEREEAISGVASPRDVATLFELVYLYFASPRTDSLAFRAYQSRAKASLAERDRSPEQAWADTLRATLTGDHPRARSLSGADFDRMDRDRSLAFYCNRFADAGDWTFYLVGNFRPDSLRPLVERYLGSLPATGRVEQGRDLGIRTPRGVVRETVRRGSEPKARTQLVWSGRRGVGVARAGAGVPLQHRLRRGTGTGG